MSKIVVFGGAGFLGTHVCEKLVERHRGDACNILVPTRRLGHARHLQPLPGLDTAQADVFDPARLDRLLYDAEVVINLVGILHGHPADFERVHATLPQRLAAASVKAGVRRFIHVSALGASADAPSHYLRSKAAGEAALASQPGLATTVLRPSVMFGDGDRFLNLFASLQRLFPVMPLASAGARFQPVWVEDVARGVVACLDRHDSAGQVYEAVGPRVYTLAELVRCAGVWSGHARPVWRLPEALGRLQAAAMRVLPGDPLISADNLDSMKVDSVASGRLPDLQALGVSPAALEAIAPLYLGGTAPTRLDLFRASARRS
ncbi:complex I NDUFA9 subunit family protein [Caldimonas brevitalea]|uniref:NAD-dependent dehydratase n=1 Tax=Caldimonas brevitalea TaxID=413882 RepID=A0A0G3BCY8_9BURK|nr:complex I NDUFA9 subunit family protein [Caldimonas brevitalea]AKJ27254.1 NAD-dependent dehydratase [Caldimonas brevitalea]